MFKQYTVVGNAILSGQNGKKIKLKLYFTFDIISVKLDIVTFISLYDIKATKTTLRT